MHKLNSIIHTVIISCLSLILPACSDDFGYYDGGYGEGETNVSLEVSFQGFESTPLTRSTVAPPANGFNTLSDLVILVYDNQGNLLEGETGMQNIEFSQNQLTNDNRGDSDASGDKTTESSTLSLKNIPVRLPFGEYYIIAVANLGTYQDNNGNIATLTSTYDTLKAMNPEEYNTVSKLRRMRVNWVDNDYRNNREMLGFFADPSAKSPSATSYFTTVRVDRPGISLRAWLRRCVSKITIDFDGSGLRDDVEVFIKSARVYDYATSCSLGFGSATNENEADYNNRPAADDDIKSGSTAHVIDYTVNGNGSDPNDMNFGAWGTKITVTNPYLMEGGKKKDFHGESAFALYFYENMQDNPEPKKSKIPLADLIDGGVQNATEKKDGIKYGTYVEVEAYYHCNRTDNMSDGPIKYRFMLGKNVTDNFEAERNHHYKLTLKLRGNANDFDWHIDFDQTPGFDVPNPWYVSYLYNHDAYLPFKFTCPEGYELVDLTAKIESNPWYSTSEHTEAELRNPNTTFEKRIPFGEDGNLAYSGDNVYTGNGFLSLRAPRHDGTVTGILATGGKTFSDNGGYIQKNKNINQEYFDGKIGGINHGFRTIMSNGIVDEAGTKHNERTQYNGDETNIKSREKLEYRREKNTWTFEMPLFTREKILVKETGYTGNNPFVGYQRVAKILMTAKVRNIKNHSDVKVFNEKVNCIQVQRVLNPKGVYRKAGNYAPFNVVLMSLNSDAANAVFSPIISQGSWTADIIGDKNFITLDGKQSVSGTTGSQIRFNIRFNRLSTGNKNAVVKVRYHNYTCTHLIFVRQGYDAQAISLTGKNFNGESQPAPVWETFNMISRDKMATDPRDEGSMFKFGNSGDAIDVSNNIYKDTEGKPMYHHLSVNEFNTHMNSALGPFKMLDNEGRQTDNKEWNDITHDANGFTSGAMSKAATVRDYEQLYLTPNIQFGYGVLYADGATETQTTLANAYGWWRDDIDANKNEKGMRGVFAYYYNGDLTTEDSYNGRNVFFPIGRAGYGHRKNGGNEDTRNTGKGVLRYSSNRSKPASQHGNSSATGSDAWNFQHVAPLFEYLFRRSGAIYWFRNTAGKDQYLEWNGEKGGGTAYGCDFNFFTFDVNAITGGNVSNGEDAAFVRTVR